MPVMPSGTLSGLRRNPKTCPLPASAVAMSPPSLPQPATRIRAICLCSVIAIDNFNPYPLADKVSATSTRNIRPEPTMTLTELRYVVTLARERHFGRAAERCHVSQPTLSVAVKKLEDELGISLFERSKSSIRVTEVGQRIIEQSQRVLDQVGVIRDMSQDGKNQLNSPLKVGAIYTIGPYLFPHLLPELRRAAPEMPLYIEENYTASLRQKLRQSELDAIIIALPFEEPEVVTLPLYDEPFVVLLPAGHPLAAKDSLTAEEIAREQLLLLGPGHCFRDQVLESCPPLVEAVTQHAGNNTSGPALVTEGSSLETI